MAFPLLALVGIIQILLFKLAINIVLKRIVAYSSIGLNSLKPIALLLVQLFSKRIVLIIGRG